MAHEMTKLRALADVHMKRDLEAKGKWVCECEACGEIRSMFGLEKMLALRPLVREIQDVGDQLADMSEGPERDVFLKRYLELHDRLAEVMAQ